MFREEDTIRHIKKWHTHTNGYTSSIGVLGFNETPGLMPFNFIFWINSCQFSINQQSLFQVIQRRKATKLLAVRKKFKKESNSPFEASTWKVKPEAPAFANGST